MPRQKCGFGGHDITLPDAVILVSGVRRCRLCYERKHHLKAAPPVIHLCVHQRNAAECRVCFLDRRAATRRREDSRATVPVLCEDAGMPYEDV